MSNPSREYPPEGQPQRGRDRRRSERFDTSLEVAVRFLPDGEPLVEASYVHISFEHASNNTRCEGRVVWTERNKDGSRYESGIDIQRWGGENPPPEFIKKVPTSGPKKDRRQFRR